MFFTYILKSLKTGKYYIGHTSNIEERLLRHNENREKYTKNRGPWELVYKERFHSKAEAQQHEYAIKRAKSRTYIENLIKQVTCLRRQGAFRLRRKGCRFST